VINKCFHGFVSFCSHLSRMRAAVGGRFAREEQLARSQIPRKCLISSRAR
jgi:hypothetical protein